MADPDPSAGVERRPAPGEELNEGPERPARAAASVILLRDGPDGPEVLLVERNPAQRFMGGAWVFPGGGVDPGEEAADTGVRELEEEASIALGGVEELVAYSRWITPREVTIRFDTYFFVARAPEGAEPRPDGSECVDAVWRRPADALTDHGRGELELVFPTIRHLEELATFDSVEACLDHARRLDVAPVTPRVVTHEGRQSVVMPGEPGYHA